MTEEEIEKIKKTKEENKKRLIVALAIFLGADIDNKIEHFDSIPKDIKKQAEKIYEQKQFDNLVQSSDTRLPERDIQIKIADIGNSISHIHGTKNLYKLVGTKDEKTCEDCAKWQGTIVSMYDDGKHKTVEDFINTHVFHPNCRCSLQPVDVEEIPLNPLNPRYEERKAINPTVYNTINENNLRMVIL